jgi:hypothetical protein
MQLKVDIIPVSDIDRSKGVLRALGLEVRRRRRPARRASHSPVHAAGLRVFDHVRQGAHLRCTWLSRGGLVVSDIEAAREELVGRGIDATDEWHGRPFPAVARQPAPDPQRTSCGSFFSFNDPDSNTCLSRRSPRGSPAGSTPLARRSHPRRTWRVRFGVPRRPTASMSGAPGCETRTARLVCLLRRGRTGRGRPADLTDFVAAATGQRRASVHPEQPSTLAADETQSPGCRFAKVKRQPLRLELRDHSH